MYQIKLALKEYRLGNEAASSSTMCTGWDFRHLLMKDAPALGLEHESY
jgi:hypothetical protein